MEIQYICALLHVFDMKASLDFYTGILGFEICQSAGEPDDIDWVWLTKKHLHLMLNTQYELSCRPANPEPERVKTHGDTILFLGTPDVDAVYQELVAKGAKCDPPQAAPWGMKQLYLYDPDGYGICFQCEVN